MSVVAEKAYGVLMRRSRALLAPAAAVAVGLASWGVGASPAQAGPCTVQGGSSEDFSEWSIQVTFRSKGLSCASVKTILRACDTTDKLKGWKISNDGERIRFTSTKDSSRFAGKGAGGAPRCVSV